VQKDEEAVVKEIAEELDVSLDGVRVSAERRGRVKEDNTQLLVVKLTDEKRSEPLRAARRLRVSTKFKNVFLEPDLTPAEQHEQFLLRKELRELRNKHPDKNFRIKGGIIVEV